MNRTTRPFVILAALALLASGCGGSGKTAATTTKSDAKPASRQTSEAALKVAVRTAIRADHQLSLYVLWHNEVPKWATRSTRGPALKALRNAAATRRKQGIQIKNLVDSYTLSAITLDASYTSATAVVRSHQRVAPFEHGHRLGRAIVANDHARFELHRLANTDRFVVWRLTPIR